MRVPIIYTLLFALIGCAEDEGPEREPFFIPSDMTVARMDADIDGGALRSSDMGIVTDMAQLMPDQGTSAQFGPRVHP